MNAPLYPLFALSRHRLGSDGAGVTTLAAARGCPLRCKYCLNPQALREETPVRLVAPAQLYAMTRVDGLYFQATGGGVTCRTRCGAVSGGDARAEAAGPQPGQRQRND